MKKNNILFIETGLGFGGAVICLAALIKKLDREKYNPIVLSIHSDAETRKIIQDAGAKFIHAKVYVRKKYINNLLRKLTHLGILKYTVYICLFPFERIRKFPFIIKMRRIVKRENVDLIYLNNGLNDNEETVITARLSKIPCISHIRGPVYNSFIARFVSKYINSFISVSRFAADSLKELGINPEKVNIVYDGIDLINAEREKIKPIKNSELYLFDKRNVGHFACLMQWKGHKIFIEAINILIKEKGLKDCKFFIVGDVPDKKSNYKQELINMVNSLGLSNSVIFMGYQSNVYNFMNKMDMVVHTSIEPEPLGTVIIEAMTLGKPVIATKMGGPLEMIEDGIDGFLIPPNEPYILAEIILSLLNNNDTIKQISERAKETARKKFSIEEHTKEIEQTYEEILQLR